MSDRKFEDSIDIQATPEAVWKAITEGSEIVKWFAPIVRVKPGAGGEIYLSWGPGMEGTAPIRDWEEGKRYSWVEGEGTERPKVAEFSIEAKDASTTTLRIVQSGFLSGGSFDDEFESINGGWKTFLAMLKYGAENFLGAPAAHVWTMRIIPMPSEEAWTRVLQSLAITPIAGGAPFRAKLGPLNLEGTIIRTPKPGYFCSRVASVDNSLLAVFVEKAQGSAMVTFQWILFNDTRERAEEIKSAIDGFLDATFPAPATATTGN